MLVRQGNQLLMRKVFFAHEIGFFGWKETCNGFFTTLLCHPGSVGMPPLRQPLSMLSMLLADLFLVEQYTGAG